MASMGEWIEIVTTGAPWAFAVLFTGLVFAGGVRSFLMGLDVRSNEPVSANRARAESGVVEVEGIARPVDETLEAPLSGEPCVGYTWEEERDFEPHDPRPDWERVDDEEDVVPFYVEDETGRIAVDPEGAWLAFQRNESERDGERKEREHRLEPGDEVHVYGQKHDAVEAHDAFPGENVYIGDGDAVPSIKITQGDERRVVLKLVLVGGLVVLVGGFLFALSVWGALSDFGLL